MPQKGHFVRIWLIQWLYCALFTAAYCFPIDLLKREWGGSHWGVIMDKSNHVIFVWALLWQQHSLVMCPLGFDWSNSLHLMALSVCVKCVYKWKSIFAPPGDSICSSFVSLNCDESSKSRYRGSNWKDTRTPRIVCIYNPRSFCPRIWFIYHTEGADLRGATRLPVVAGTTVFISPTAPHPHSHPSFYTAGSPNKQNKARSRLWAGRRCTSSACWGFLVTDTWWAVSKQGEISLWRNLGYCG